MNDFLNSAVQRIHKEIGRSYQTRVNLEADNRDIDREVLADRLSREPLTRKALDDACRYWIENGKWPMMDSEAGLWISDRLGEAYLLAGWLHHNGFRNDSKTENELLDFFLVECWEPVGLRKTQARLVS